MHTHVHKALCRATKRQTQHRYSSADEWIQKLEDGEELLSDWVSIWREEKVLEQDVWFYNMVNILNTTGLCTLNWLSVM